MQTLQQARAQHALGQVKSWVALNDASKLKARVAPDGASKLKARVPPDGASQLKARCSELPFMIHANGLGQAAAFFKSKKEKDGYNVVFAALQSWLLQPGRPFADKSDLMQAIVDGDLHAYRMAQAEAIQYMDWVKKFASAYLAD